MERPEWTAGVIGAAIEVHRGLGPGFLERIYEEALAVELELRGLEFERQVAIPLGYKGRDLGHHRLDLLVQSRVIVELKAVENLHENHRATLVSYLRASGLTLGLLLNFNAPKLQIQRLIHDRSGT